MKFKRTLSAVLSSVLAFGALCLPANALSVSDRSLLNSVVEAEYQSAVNTAVSAPTSTMPSGSYVVKDGFKITLKGRSDYDEIWYSLNGTGFRRYTAPLSITQTGTVRTYLVSGGKQSDTVTYSYELIPMFSISQNSGTYNGIQRIFISCDTPDTKIYYTLDGSNPSERSAEYTSNGIVIGTSSTLKVVAVRSGWTRFVRTYNYTINGGRDVSDDLYPDGGLVITNTAEKSTGLLEDYTSKWGYNQLSTSQKAAYEKLFNAAKNYDAQVDISDLKMKAADFEKVYWAFDYDNPQFLALGSGYSYYYYVSTGYLKSVVIQYSRTYTQVAAIQPLFDLIAKNVVDTAKTQLTDYLKLKYIHDWIVNNTKYTLNGPVYKSEADGAVVYGAALCEGYSKAFMYMAQQLGFECICVVGRANGNAHMWNMVKMGGAWYHVDVTFDDPVASDGRNILTHDYFLVGTYEISKTHTIDNPVSIPSAPRSY